MYFSTFNKSLIGYIELKNSVSIWDSHKKKEQASYNLARVRAICVFSIHEVEAP